ncbi:MAG: plastocyanin/azurin family copper-binding protein [Streptosporangiaceae bacterium]
MRVTGPVPSFLAACSMAAAVVLAGCGGSASLAASSSPAARSSATSGSAQLAGGQNVTIVGTSGLMFSPRTVHVHSGVVQITLTDMGAYPHDIVIPALGVTSKTVTGDPGSGSVSFTVTFPHPGRYAFYCLYHQSAGMTGAFMVS